VGTGPWAGHPLVDFKQCRRYFYAIQHFWFKSRESLRTDPATSAGASDDRGAERPWRHAGKWVRIPNAPSQQAPGSPTAVTFNGSTTDFLLASGKPAAFLFVTEDGTIQDWNSPATTAVIEVDNSQLPSKNNGAVYKGATIAEIDGSEYILAANFRSGRIDVFDSNFKPVSVPQEAFRYDGIPPGFAPFNVQGIGPNIYVTFAQQDSAKHDPVGGAGLGYVVVFDGPWQKHCTP
jgi:uncharacterized protein (TIGR03118 family)